MWYSVGKAQEPMPTELELNHMALSRDASLLQRSAKVFKDIFLAIVEMPSSMRRLVLVYLFQL